MLNKDLNSNFAGLMTYLIRDGLLDTELANQVLLNAKQQNVSFISYLVRSNILSSSVILEYCEKNFGLPIFDLRYYDITWLKDSNITLEFIYRYRFLPLQKDHHHFYVGISDPTDHAIIATIGFQTGLRIRPMLVSEAELDQILNTYCTPGILDSKLQTALSKIIPIEEPIIEDSTTQNDEPVIDFVNRLIQDAILKQVSDIHIEPYEQHCRIRFRRDGLLSQTTTLPLPLSTRVITRLKIMANLNIAERRMPQDGRISLNEELEKTLKIDIRINVCPTVFGEKLVLRLLDTRNINLNINNLGFTDEQKKLFFKKLHQPQGLILVTGPTGSGKTLTLYSALHYLNQIEKNISSVEDPVEINLHGINQVNINPKIGLDFASVLRTFLRQDPDIIMVGEIRDAETAHIAIQASQTGHLVLSTLHANTAIDAITRLHAMGINTLHLIQSSPLLIAQRLLRKLCQSCKQAEILPIEYFNNHPAFISYRAVGCDQCQLGYKGRIGTFELISITNQLTEHTMTDGDVKSILQNSLQQNFMQLSQSGMLKVKEGVTSYAELERVIGGNFHE